MLRHALVCAEDMHRGPCLVGRWSRYGCKYPSPIHSLMFPTRRCGISLSSSGYPCLRHCLGNDTWGCLPSDRQPAMWCSSYSSVSGCSLRSHQRLSFPRFSWLSCRWHRWLRLAALRCQHWPQWCLGQTRRCTTLTTNCLLDWA